MATTCHWQGSVFGYVFCLPKIYLSLPMQHITKYISLWVEGRELEGWCANWLDSLRVNQPLVTIKHPLINESSSGYQSLVLIARWLVMYSVWMVAHQ